MFASDATPRLRTYVRADETDTSQSSRRDRPSHRILDPRRVRPRIPGRTVARSVSRHDPGLSPGPGGPCCLGKPACRDATPPRIAPPHAFREFENGPYPRPPTAAKGFRAGRLPAARGAAAPADKALVRLSAGPGPRGEHHRRAGSMPAGSFISRTGRCRVAAATRKAARRRPFRSRTGGDLLSQGVAPQVPSALWCLTALFGMGRGVSTTLLRHRKYVETMCLDKA